ncbi:MAG: DUF4365 domain-containing protein [bacterium]
MAQTPSYVDRKRKGNIGEIFVQYVLSSFCLVHKIDGGQDLGNDFICELTKGEFPTNILFYAQVKYWKDKPQDVQIKKTIEYWKNSSIPVYLFWVKDNDKLPELNANTLKPEISVPLLQYKRYTPIVHKNKELKMKKFSPFIRRIFLRDLMVDYSRCLYKRGMTTVIEKNDFIELDKANVPLGDKCLFVGDVIPNEYKNEIIDNSWTNLLATASSLAVSSHKTSLELASKNIQLAREMFNQSSKANIKYSGFKKIIDNLEKKIKDKISEVWGE